MPASDPTTQPQPPALGFFAVMDTQAAVAHPSHARCPVVEGMDVNLALVVTGADGIATWHVVNGMKVPCVLRRLEKDARVRWVEMRKMELGEYGEVRG